MFYIVVDEAYEWLLYSVGHYAELGSLPLSILYIPAIGSSSC